MAAGYPAWEVKTAVRRFPFDDLPATCSTDQSIKGFALHTPKVFECLKKHGQLLDSEIAEATGIELYEVHAALSELFVQGEIARCRVTSYINGIPMEGFQCRLVGYSLAYASRYGHDDYGSRNRPSSAM